MENNTNSASNVEGRSTSQATDARMLLRTYDIRDGCVVPTITLAQAAEAAAAAPIAIAPETDRQKTSPSPQTTQGARQDTAAGRSLHQNERCQPSQKA